MAMKFPVVFLQAQIVSVVRKACRGNGNQVGGSIYSQLITLMPLTTLAASGGGGDPPTTTPPPLSKPSSSRSRRPSSEKDIGRMKMGECLGALMGIDTIYTVTSTDATAVRVVCEHGWPGTHVVMHTDTDPREKSKIKKIARECGIEPKTASHWEEEEVYAESNAKL